MKAGSGPFRLRWRGYDRTQVSEFLQRTAVERQVLEVRLDRLEARLARLEAAGAPGRVDSRWQAFSLTGGVDATSRLGPAFEALSKAARQLAGTPAKIEQRGAQPLVSRLPSPPPAPRPSVDFQLIPPSSQGKRMVPMLALGVGLAVTGPFLYRHEPSASAIPPPAVVIEATPQIAEVVAEPVRLVEYSEDIALTLTARQPCWIRATIDGGPPLERLLNPGQTLTLRALDEAVLRVGNAAALSLLINDVSARPLGADGQPVTVRITPSNYSSFFADGTGI